METKSVSAALVYWNCLMQLSSQDNFIDMFGVASHHWVKSVVKQKFCEIVRVFMEQ